jgi:hypothetical protein
VNPLHVDWTHEGDRGEIVVRGGLEVGHAGMLRGWSVVWGQGARNASFSADQHCPDMQARPGTGSRRVRSGFEGDCHDPPAIHVHDPALRPNIRTGEFLNVGVVVHVPASSEVLFRTRTTCGWVKSVFPDLDGEAFRDAMSAVRCGLDEI